MQKYNRAFLRAAILLGICVSAYVAYSVLSENIHTISEGQAYRSGQLSAAALEQCILKFKIKSILNLRGPNPGEKWYEEEIHQARQHKVAYYEISLSSGEAPGARQIEQIEDTLLHAPRPILIHCQGGSDRTGLVSAMWKIMIDQAKPHEAEKQLSFYYGHLSIGNTKAMDDAFQAWMIERMKKNRAS